MPSTLNSRKSFTRSLKFRLMLWNAVVVVVTACVTLLALREGVRITLIRELDQLLEEDLNEIAIALAAHEDPESLREQLDRKDAGHARHDWFAELVGADGRVQYESKHAPPASVWESPGAAAARSGARTVGEWRLQSRAIAGAGVSIRVGASLKLIHEDTARLDRLVALAVCGVLVVAPLCGYWLAVRATRPLAKIIATTARLRPSQLDERLEIRGTGDELDQLSAKFNRLLDRIGKYLQERRDFLANSAHELRTPLAAIRSSIEVALSGGRTNEEYQELLTDVIEESASLELLVNQLLLLSETEAERLKVDQKQVAMEHLVEKALDMFGGVAEYREIQLQCSALPSAPVLGNQEHLRQVVYNLLDNALKFTPTGGRVTVRLQADAERNAVVFSVEDTGPGIPLEELPHVFDRFFQGSRTRAASAERRGTGLGLSICQAIVRAHDGSIEVERLPNTGARFTVRLPRSEGGPSEEFGGQSAAADRTGRRRDSAPPASDA